MYPTAKTTAFEELTSLGGAPGVAKKCQATSLPHDMHAGDRKFTNNTSEQGLKKSINHHDLPFLFSKLSLLTEITKIYF